MTNELFDMRTRAMRRDRAHRLGPELFLYERAFGDVLERLELVRRPFRSALLIGCPDPAWRQRLASLVAMVDVVDPGPRFALAHGARCAVEDALQLDEGVYDLCVAIGTLDTVNDLPTALRLIRLAVRDDALFIGALSGGDTLPRLRGAMRAADAQMVAASPHIHPRIEPQALSMLLAATGFIDPVVDVDRVQVAYSSLWDLVRDLRAMGATNLLSARSRGALSRSAVEAAVAAFAEDAASGRTIERFELLHFAAWTSPARKDEAALTQ